MIKYVEYVDQLTQCLNGLIVTNDTGQTLDQEEGLSQWCSLTLELSKSNKTMFFVGNGASAMMASHMAADASKNGGFRAIAFNDAALMTAVGNDISYEQIFAIPLTRYANPGDALVTISSSGNSPNVIAAIEAAKKMELNVFTLSGMNPSNKSRQMGTLNYYIPAETYGFAEAGHQAILHAWLDTYMEEQGISI